MKLRCLHAQEIEANAGTRSRFLFWPPSDSRPAVEVGLLYLAAAWAILLGVLLMAFPRLAFMPKPAVRG
jgi:hypothetical protein